MIALAKTLIKTWKKFVPESAEKKEKKAAEAEAKKAAGKEKDGGDKNAAGGDPSKSFPTRPQATSDEVRLRCRDMLTKALEGDGKRENGTPGCIRN